jgi:hypothetical protein
MRPDKPPDNRGQRPGNHVLIKQRGTQPSRHHPSQSGLPTGRRPTDQQGGLTVHGVHRRSYPRFQNAGACLSVARAATLGPPLRHSNRHCPASNTDSVDAVDGIHASM